MTPLRRVAWKTTTLALTACLYLLVTASPLFALPPGLVSAWSGNGNVLDSTGNNNATFTGSYVAGHGGQQAFAFNGTSTQFTTSANGFPTGSANRTISMWVYMNTFTYPWNNETALFGYGTHQSGAQQDFILMTEGNQWLVANNGVQFLGPTLSTSTWYYVAVVQNNNSQQLYVNGVLVATGALPINTPAAGVTAGYFPDPPYTTFYLNGNLQNIRVYNQALTATQISADMVGSVPEPPAVLLLGCGCLIVLVSKRSIIS